MTQPARVLVLGVPLAILAAFAAATFWPDKAIALPVAPRGASGAVIGQAAKELVEVEVRDVVPLDTPQTHAVMLVSKDGTVLPLFVSEESAVAIAFRLAHRPAPHPLAADLADSVLSQLGGQVLEVRIDDIQEHVFYGRVILRQGTKRIAIEARPSDAIALALTGGARIFATRKVLSEGGITRQEIERERAKGEAQEPPLMAYPILDGGIRL